LFFVVVIVDIVAVIIVVVAVQVSALYFIELVVSKVVHLSCRYVHKYPSEALVPHDLSSVIKSDKIFAKVSLNIASPCIEY
jgi:hypothetical protein